MRGMTRIASGVAMIALLASPALPVAAAPPQNAPAVQVSAPASIPVSIEVDAGVRRGPLKPIWRFFGADEPNYATMKDGRKLLAIWAR
jgi:xylan 1,4-beta-xylosidase